VTVRVRQTFDVVPVQEAYSVDVAQDRWSFMVVCFRQRQVRP
jgi:hypothetical protein